jgi:hypothetical protein
MSLLHPLRQEWFTSVSANIPQHNQDRQDTDFAADERIPVRPEYHQPQEKP